MIYDLAIIGGGPAGYTAAELAGKNGLKTVLFEKNNLGGICLNEGCIPTKTLLYSAKVYQTARDAAKYAISCENVAFDLPKIIARKTKIVRKLTAGIRAKMNEAGVETVIGEAIVKAKGEERKATEIECNGQIYSANKLLLCTGSETVVPPIPGLKETAFWTSREALENKEVTESLLIIGGGVIGIEFASFFNTLGAKVIVVEMLDEILPGIDKQLSALLRNELLKKGIEFHLSSRVVSVNGRQIEIEKAGEKSISEASKILLSVGRKPVLTGFGLETLNVKLSGNGLKVNEYMQTSHPDIYACGDITGFSLLAHTAVREAEIAVGHILGKNEKMSYKAIPGVIYTNPETASVGKTEETLQAENTAYTVKQLPMAYSGRFVAENEQGNGVCKIIEGEDGTILGVHILGNPASEIIVIAGIAIEKGIKADELKTMIFPHPTVGEIIKETL
ncbi:MAG: dihydrolipoyl dehydrogenase [Candidatus Symbiothrix sp.]|jgi:dihydrolipoamide dehydrogenase|nr:dihydrolipoyl dehydrogenase [Candidatus Symbiothrix sp.]